jgi:hypothetical protein
MALSSLMKGALKSIRAADFQSRKEIVDLFKLGQGVMPLDFKVHHHNGTQKTISSLVDTTSERDADTWESITKRIKAFRYLPDFPRLKGIYSQIALNKAIGNSGPVRLFCSGFSVDGFSMMLQRMVSCLTQTVHSILLIHYCYFFLNTYLNERYLYQKESTEMAQSSQPAEAKEQTKKSKKKEKASERGKNELYN